MQERLQIESRERRPHSELDGAVSLYSVSSSMLARIIIGAAAVKVDRVRKRRIIFLFLF